MSALAADRSARWALGLAFGSAAALALVALWTSSGEAPEHWARARWLLAPLVVTGLAGLECATLAWRRRDDASRWMPLFGGVLTCAAAMAASLSGAL